MVQLRKVTRVYEGAGQPVVALDEVSFEIERNDFVAITGPSGCGKSTLMHLLGGLDRPTSGEVSVDGIDLHSADEKTLTRYRRDHLGIVFQFFNLLPAMTVLENVALPLVLQGKPLDLCEERAAAQLALVGMSRRAGHRPDQLSGGEMQRTAIARALVHQPALLLADEPTGNLDSANSGQVLEVLQEIHRQKLTTIVLVTHATDAARAAARTLPMRDGRLA